MTKSATARNETHASDIIYPASLAGEHGMGSTPKASPGQRPLPGSLKPFVLMYTTIAAAIILSIVYGTIFQRHDPAEVSKADIAAFIREMIAPEVKLIKELAWANEESLLELQKAALTEHSLETAVEAKLDALGEVLATKRASSSADMDELEKAVDQLRSRMSSLGSMQERVADLYEELERKAEAVADSAANPEPHGSEASMVTLDVAEARKVVRDALEEIHADGVGLSDFALGTLGARVERRFGLTSSSYVPESEAATVVERIRDFFFFPSPKPAETAIHGDNSIGNCWACKLPNCNLTVALLRPISPSAVTLDHISPKIAYNIESAPRDFRVYGVALSKEGPEEVLLGTYSYELDKGRTQTYALDNVDGRAFAHVKLQVVSNHGHEEYTCLYRFRVHRKRS